VLVGVFVGVNLVLWWWGHLPGERGGIGVIELLISCCLALVVPGIVCGKGGHVCRGG
jgi:hypothetical protein